MSNRFLFLSSMISYRIPSFSIRFKDESYFMRFIGIFNKRFLTNVSTSIGTTVYFPSKKVFDNERYFDTLCHEYVHLMDYKQNKIRFVLGYLFPQILFIFSLLAFVNIWFLLFLIFLLPIPSPTRMKYEMRGYGMSCKAKLWKGQILSEELVNSYVKAFSSPLYYYMFPFKKTVRRKLRKYIDNDDCILDINPAYADVFYTINENI